MPFENCAEFHRIRSLSDSGFSPLGQPSPRPWPFEDFLFELNNAFDLQGSVPEPAECIHFSGMALLGETLIFGAAELTKQLRSARVTVTDLLAATGYFTAIVRDGDRLVFANDLLGLEHLYWFHGPQGPVISNRQHALVAHLRERGFARSLNLNYVGVMLSSTHAFFRQFHAHELAISGLELVPADRYAVYAKGHLSLITKPTFAKAWGRDAGDYSALVDDAASEIIKNIRAVCRSGRFTQCLTDLSGGRDSRVTFGAILSGGLQREITVSSRDEPDTQDLKHALRIAEYYHAPFFIGDENGPELMVEDAAEALQFWRSSFMGAYHRMFISPWSARGADVRTVRFTGNCGEIYSAFWSKWLGKTLAKSSSNDTLDAIFGRVAPMLAFKHHKPAKSAFFECILELPGDSLGEKLDNHYLFYRNRAHFGLRAYPIQVDVVPWAPLVSPSLLLASRKLSWEIRQRGKVMFDVLDRLAPELNLFKYESGPWPEDFVSSAPSGHRPPFDFEQAKRRWDEAETRRHINLSTRARGKGPKFSAAEFKALVRKQIGQAMSTILDAEPALATMLGGFEKTTLELFDIGNDRDWRVAASKVFSVADSLL